MSCTPVRIDHLDDNTSSAGPSQAAGIYDPTAKKVYYAYANRIVASSASYNSDIWFRAFDPAAQTFGSPVNIETVTTPGVQVIFHPSLLRLSNGTLICIYNLFNLDSTSCNQTYARESTDNGATWSARAKVDGLSGVSRNLLAAATDGTNVSVWVYDNGTFGGSPPGKSMWHMRRTGIGTWAAADQVFVGSTGNEVIVPTVDLLQHGIISGTKRALIVCRELTSGTLVRVTCFYSADSGATWAEHVIRPDAAIVAVQPYPRSMLGTDGRIRVCYPVQSGLNAIPEFAYSDDLGLTWTIVGTPAILAANPSSFKWNQSGFGFNVGSTNALFAATWDQSGADWVATIYAGGDSLTGWTVGQTCNVGPIAIGNHTGDLFFDATNAYFAFDMTGTSPTRLEIDYLSETIPPDTGGPPPLSTESPLGTDIPDRYLRLRAAERRGWSAHDLSVACWSLWGEGDYTTERRKRFLIAAAGIIDPTLDSPAHIPALWKLDDPERYTREVLATDAGGNTIVSADPFAFELVTRDMEMGTLFGTSLLRGFSIRYIRPAGNFTVEFLVDDKIAYTETLGPSPLDSYADVFLPCPTDDNDGSRCRLRIYDLTEYPLILGPIQPKWIDKGIRG